MVFLVGMALVACDRILAVAMVTLAITINGLQAPSQPVNHLDIAPIYAGKHTYCLKMILFTYYFPYSVGIPVLQEVMHCCTHVL